ncbi:MAG: hypothetical protein K0R15_1643 [Clostridiales bacterium]|jgi:hypothetical protein|nr:hypothetical protein [Clostridiales bacterium]
MNIKLKKTQIAISIISLIIFGLVFYRICWYGIFGGMLLHLFDEISLWFTNAPIISESSYLILWVYLLIGSANIIALIVGLAMSFKYTRNSAIILSVCNIIQLILLWIWRVVIMTNTLLLIITICAIVMCLITSIYIAIKTPKAIKFRYVKENQ